MYYNSELKISETFNFKGKQIILAAGDITKARADAIASSDDTHLSMSGGVSAAIRKVGGEIIWNEAVVRVPAKLGTALVTSAGNLHAQYVIHVVVINYENWIFPDIDMIGKATENCLKEADNLGCKTIAMPAFGTGTGELAPETTAYAMLKTISNTFERFNNLEKVIIVLNRQDVLLDFLKISIENKIRSEYEDKLNVLKREKEELAEKIRKESPYKDIPFPIAIARRTIDIDIFYHSKFTRTVNCAESIIKYFTSIAMADLVRLESSSFTEIFSFFSRKPTPGLGSWLDQLKEILKYLKDKSDFSFVHKLQTFYSNQENRRCIEEFRQERNYAAHGSTLSESEYQNKYKKLLSMLDKMIDSASFMREYPLVMVTQIDIIDNFFEYEIIKITGDNVFYPKEVFKCKELRLSRNILYLLDMEKEQGLQIQPFLVFETCPHCQLQETFFLEKNTHKKSGYHTYRADHRMDTDKYLHYFNLGT